MSPFSTGNTIWAACFDETQRALSEDLLQLNTFINRKGRWVSAAELADFAMKEIFEEVLTE